MDRTIRKTARTVATYTSALWSLYRAGHFGYRKLKYALGLSKSKQKEFIARYKKSKIPQKEISKLKRQVKNISKVLSTDLSKRTYRQRDSAVEGVSANTKRLEEMVGCNNTIIEAALTNMRYWSESTGAYVNASPLTTASNELLISKLYSKCWIRNNYQIPCDVEFYCVVPRDDTSLTVTQCYDNGLADQNNPANTSPLLYLTDSDLFKRMWKVKSSIKRRLNPGEECSLMYTCKPFSYDPATVDSHALTYQARFNAHVYVVRVSGILAHDTIADEQGCEQAAVDICRDVTITVTYDCGGPSLNDFSVVDNSDSFTNSAVVSLQPVADNLPYSKS